MDFIITECPYTATTTIWTNTKMMQRTWQAWKRTIVWSLIRTHSRQMASIRNWWRW